MIDYRHLDDVVFGDAYRGSFNVNNRYVTVGDISTLTDSPNIGTSDLELTGNRILNMFDGVNSYTFGINNDATAVMSIGTDNIVTIPLLEKTPGDPYITLSELQSNAPEQNLFETITADTGSTTADSSTDTLNVVGGTNIETEIVGDTLTINVINNSGGPEEDISNT